MDEKPLVLASLAFSVFGLFLMQAFSPAPAQRDATIIEVVGDCGGYATVSGLLTKTFYSQAGNYLGTLAQNRTQLNVMLRDAAVIQGDRVRVFGKLSKFSGACWLFAERVDVID